MKCRRCRIDAEDFETPGIIELVHLRGYIFVELCSDCRTDWGETLDASDAYRETRGILARRQWLGGRAGSHDPPSLQEWEDQMEREHQNDLRCNRLAKTFLQSHDRGD